MIGSAVYDFIDEVIFRSKPFVAFFGDHGSLLFGITFLLIGLFYIRLFNKSKNSPREMAHNPHRKGARAAMADARQDLADKIGQLTSLLGSKKNIDFGEIARRLDKMLSDHEPITVIGKIFKTWNIDLDAKQADAVTRYLKSLEEMINQAVTTRRKILVSEVALVYLVQGDIKRFEREADLELDSYYDQKDNFRHAKVMRQLKEEDYRVEIERKRQPSPQELKQEAEISNIQANTTKILKEVEKEDVAVEREKWNFEQTKQTIDKDEKKRL
jgi:hypothetical protein